MGAPKPAVTPLSPSNLAPSLSRGVLTHRFVHTALYQACERVCPRYEPARSRPAASLPAASSANHNRRVHQCHHIFIHATYLGLTGRSPSTPVAALQRKRSPGNTVITVRKGSSEGQHPQTIQPAQSTWSNTAAKPVPHAFPPCCAVCPNHHTRDPPMHTYPMPHVLKQTLFNSNKHRTMYRYRSFKGAQS